MGKQRLIIIYKAQPDRVKELALGKSTCGYREYARCFGTIIYPFDSSKRKPWEAYISNPKEIIEFTRAYPDAIVWVVKALTQKDNRRNLVPKINNFKAYYSCSAKKTHTKMCDISLVDIPERIRTKEHRLWIKGKDPDFWAPQGQKKEFDYLIQGRRDKKNQTWFINELEKIKKPRSILWVGGKAYRSKIKSRHHVEFTSFGGPDFVRKHMPRAKVGVLFSEIPTEGFPQAFLEMTMCGLPVAYGGPFNKNYFFNDNSNFVHKKSNLLSAAEDLLGRYNPKKCRETAIENYSIERSMRYLESLRDELV